jgi:hypothetical protein
MKAASLNEIRKQLSALDSDALEKICLRLARYKVENKELMTYLLFEAHDEQAYVSGIRSELDALFETLPKGNVYYVKKSVRKIVRVMNKQIKYSGMHLTELEVRIYFCLKMKAQVPLQEGTVLFNLYQQQLGKIEKILSRIPEDLRFDYDRDLNKLGVNV